MLINAIYILFPSKLYSSWIPGSHQICSRPLRTESGGWGGGFCRGLGLCTWFCKYTARQWCCMWWQLGISFVSLKLGFRGVIVHVASASFTLMFFGTYKPSSFTKGSLQERSIAPILQKENLADLRSHWWPASPPVRLEIKASDGCGNGESYFWADPPLSPIPSREKEESQTFLYEAYHTGPRPAATPSCSCRLGHR